MKTVTLPIARVDAFYGGGDGGQVEFALSHREENDDYLSYYLNCRMTYREWIEKGRPLSVDKIIRL